MKGSDLQQRFQLSLLVVRDSPSRGELGQVTRCLGEVSPVSRWRKPGRGQIVIRRVEPRLADEGGLHVRYRLQYILDTSEIS